MRAEALLNFLLSLKNTVEVVVAHIKDKRPFPRMTDRESSSEVTTKEFANPISIRRKSQARELVAQWRVHVRTAADNKQPQMRGRR